jgi:hypothetical protein
MKSELPQNRESYAIMNELRRGLLLSSSQFNYQGKELLSVKITYRTLDDKVHLISEALVELKNGR